MGSYADKYRSGVYATDFAKKAEGHRRPGRARAEGDARLMSLLGKAAPVVGAGAGALIGGLATGGAGVAPGMAIGGGLGQLAGAGLEYGADERMQPYDEEEQKRQARFAAVQQIFKDRR